MTNQPEGVDLRHNPDADLRLGDETERPTDEPQPATVRDSYGRWLKGTPSPNPHGRQRGSRNKRSRALRPDWTAIQTPGDVDAAMAALMTAVSAGKVTVEEAASLGILLGERRRALAASDLERRLRALEGQGGVEGLSKRVST